MTEYAILTLQSSTLQGRIEALLNDAGISEFWTDQILKSVEEAELSKCEADYERHQERLMENGPGPTLQEQQGAAQKLK